VPSGDSRHPDKQNAKIEPCLILNNIFSRSREKCYHARTDPVHSATDFPRFTLRDMCDEKYLLTPQHAAPRLLRKRLAQTVKEERGRSGGISQSGELGGSHWVELECFLAYSNLLRSVEFKCSSRGARTLTTSPKFFSFHANSDFLSACFNCVSKAYFLAQSRRC
jgi:hypothetical protein